MAKQITTRPLTPTEQRIAELKAQTSEKVARIRAEGAVSDLVTAVKSGKTGNDLYSVAKAFCNFVEQGRRQAKKAEEAKKPKQES